MYAPLIHSIKAVNCKIQNKSRIISYLQKCLLMLKFSHSFNSCNNMILLSLVRLILNSLHQFIIHALF